MGFRAFLSYIVDILCKALNHSSTDIGLALEVSASMHKVFCS